MADEWNKGQAEQQTQSVNISVLFTLAELPKLSSSDSCLWLLFEWPYINVKIYIIQFAESDNVPVMPLDYSYSAELIVTMTKTVSTGYFSFSDITIY